MSFLDPQPDSILSEGIVGTSGKIALKEIGPDDPVLDLIHKRLLVPYFSANDRDSCRAIHAYLSQNEENRIEKTKFHVVAAMKNGIPIATTIFAFFGAERFCLMSGHYTVVLPKERGQHLATWLDRYRQEIATVTAKRFGYDALDLSVVTMPVLNGPISVTRSARSAALLNVEKIWRHLGYRQLNFPLIQVPLADGKKATSQSLWIKRHTQLYLERDYLLKHEVEFIIEASNYFRQSKAPLTCYPGYSLMKKFLHNHSRMRFFQ